MKIILLGEQGSKRTEYFARAANELNADIEFIPLPENLDHFDIQGLQGCAVKIDPPKLPSSDIGKLNHLVGQYTAFLNRVKGFKNIRLLNSIDAITGTLDKVSCKIKLHEAGVNTTPLVASNISNIGELRQILSDKKIYSVFIKPTQGSGATGVVAYRINPQSGQENIVTSARYSSKGLFNTKKLCQHTSKEAVESIVNSVLAANAIVEKWIPKATHKGKTYDLRVVYQFGKMAYIVARQSLGPITNLHLNNDSLSVDELNLSTEKFTEIETLCCNAVKPFGGLNVVGVDVLLQSGSLKPYVIELNGQGDLIYNDIFADNTIYKEQIQQMKNW